MWRRQDREILLKEQAVKFNMVHFSFSETVERNICEAVVWKALEALACMLDYTKGMSA